MGKDDSGLTSVFEQPGCPTPDPGGTLRQDGGGFDLGDGSQAETPNSLSGLPTQIGHISVKDGPAPGSTVVVADGVTTPVVPQGNIDGGAKVTR